jgi:hypothetical protein
MKRLAREPQILNILLHFKIWFFKLRLALSDGVNIICVSHPFTWGWKQIQFSKCYRVRVKYDLEVYRQSVHLGVKPFETHYQSFFFQLNPCGNSPCVTLTRKWFFFLMNMLGLSSSVRIAHVASYWKFLLFHCIYNSSVSTDFAKQLMPIWRILM